MLQKNGLHRIVAAALFTGMISITLPLSTTAESEAQELKKVRIGVGTTFLGITYPWLLMPKALGYWADEGYDVEVLPIGASLQVAQQLVGGGIEIGQVNASVLIQSRATNSIPMRAFMTNGVIDSGITVKDESPIKTVADLKGKKIGVFSLASGHIPFLKSFLNANGVNAETDVQLIPVGLGASAVQALDSGQVDALMFWAAANASFENAGLKLRYIADPEWSKLPDFSMVTLQGTVDEDLKMLEAIARGAAKAIVFANANPDCVRQVQWKNWPDTKPSGDVDEATLIKWDLNSLAAQLVGLNAARELNESRLWGQTNKEAYGRMQDFLKDTGQITNTVPTEDLVIDDTAFFERVNDFDHEAIVASAKACQIK